MTLRIAQVGMGGWGRNWAINRIPLVEEIEAVAWVDMSQEALAAARKDLQLPAKRCFASLDAALDAVDFDAVLVTATLPGHVPVATAALEADKHVLVEKPFAPSLAAAVELVELARQRERVLMVSQNYRFFPAPRAVAALLAERKMGDPYAIDLTFRRHTPSQGYRHYDREHPLLMDMSIHHFDLMRMVLDAEPTSIYCHGWQPPGSRFSDPPAAAAIIEFEGGIVVTYQGSWMSTGPTTHWAGEWRMECTEGEIVWTSRGGGDIRTAADQVTVRSVENEKPKRVSLPKLDHTGRAGTLQAFALSVLTGDLPAYASTGADNLGSISLMMAAIESANSGRPVTL